jgi:hypothetical protein
VHIAPAVLTDRFPSLWHHRCLSQGGEAELLQPAAPGAPECGHPVCVLAGTGAGAFALHTQPEIREWYGEGGVSCSCVYVGGHRSCDKCNSCLLCSPFSKACLEPFHWYNTSTWGAAVSNINERGTHRTPAHARRLKVSMKATQSYLCHPI